jgi:hypothetical protein
VNKAAVAAICMAVMIGGIGAAPARTKPVKVPAQSHCRNDERVLYSCRFGRKTGSVCLGRNSLHYRFGLLGRPELELSSSPDWRNIHIGGNRSQLGLNQNHIRFTNLDTHYVVHAGVTGQHNERPGFRISGIVVLKGSSADHQIASLDCKAGKQFSADAYRDYTNAAPDSWDGWEPEGGPFNVIY